MALVSLKPFKWYCLGCHSLNAIFSPTQVEPDFQPQCQKCGQVWWLGSKEKQAQQREVKWRSACEAKVQLSRKIFEIVLAEAPPEGSTQKKENKLDCKIPQALVD